MRWNEIKDGSGFVRNSICYVKVDKDTAWNIHEQSYRHALEFQDDDLHLPINRGSLRMQVPQDVQNALYDAGAYAFPVPPVCTGYWLSDDWMRYINRSGYWTFQAVK